MEEMKEAVTKVIDTLTQENFHGAFQKLLEAYNKCIAAGGDYFERGLEFHVCTINKSAHTKKVWILIVCTSYICKFHMVCNSQPEKIRWHICSILPLYE